MAQISVRPDQLNAIAQSIREHSSRIQAAVQAVDAEMRRMNADVFSGQSADTLRNRYHTIQPSLMMFAPMLNKFANQLDEAAAAFRQADLAEGAAGGRSGTWSMTTTLTAGEGSGAAGSGTAARVTVIQEATKSLNWKLW